jgi:hypothetical protein
VLDRVPAQHAGSASGVFNTGLQLGNSIGIALIGVIFFGLLGTQSANAARTVAPQLRAGLTAVHVPAAVVNRIEAQFGDCLHARLVASDPTVTPAACRLTLPAGTGPAALPAAARGVLATTGATAVRHDFTAALERTLWFQVAVFLASFLLMLALPRGAGRRDPAAGNETGLASAREGVVIG